MTGKQQRRPLTDQQAGDLIAVLNKRFEDNMNRHPDTLWSDVEKALRDQPDKLWSLQQMEQTGGEPDVAALPGTDKGIAFVDCAPESPAGRRSVCYDAAALAARKEHKPAHSALGMAEEMGIEVLDESQYRVLQQLGAFDNKTSSWVKAPDDVRRQGGGFFMNRHYGLVFLYYNGAESYYAARGFRGMLVL